MRVNNRIIKEQEQMDQYMPLLQGKRIGMVDQPLLLWQRFIFSLPYAQRRQVVKVTTPERGFPW